VNAITTTEARTFAAPGAVTAEYIAWWRHPCLVRVLAALLVERHDEQGSVTVSGVAPKAWGPSSWPTTR
jgi:hypothetical protein